jgi:hypothetical protein
LILVKACGDRPEHLQRSKHPSDEETLAMPRRVALIQGHPDQGSKRLCHALADA